MNISVEEELQQLILVVDDQQDHLQVIEQVLGDEASGTQIVAISTTTEATDFILNQGQHAKAQRPDIVLLNMHLTDGQAQTLLTTIKTSAKLKQIPTIILTPEASNQDVLDGYRQQCNSFIVKPENLDHLSATLHVIKSFWLDLVTLPIKS